MKVNEILEAVAGSKACIIIIFWIFCFDHMIFVYQSMDTTLMELNVLYRLTTHISAPVSVFVILASAQNKCDHRARLA